MVTAADPLASLTIAAIRSIVEAGWQGIKFGVLPTVPLFLLGFSLTAAMLPDRRDPTSEDRGGEA